MTYSENVFVDLGIKHTMGMRHIVICVLLGSTIFFQCDSKKAQFSFFLSYWKKGILYFLRKFVRNVFILRRIRRDIIKNVYSFPRKSTVILLDFNETSFLERFSRICWNIRIHTNASSTGAEMGMRTDRQTWRRKESLFEILRKAPKT